MGAIVILLVLGICVFLIWFFEAIMKDASMDDGEVVIDLRLERDYRNAAQAGSCKQLAAGTPAHQDPMRRAG